MLHYSPDLPTLRAHKGQIMPSGFKIPQGASRDVRVGGRHVLHYKTAAGRLRVEMAEDGRLIEIVLTEGHTIQRLAWTESPEWRAGAISVASAPPAG